jgi:hypothetical protein
MKTPIETLFADCRGHFLARRMADAFPLAHHLVQRLGNERSMALLDSLKIMAECCDDAGQPFFAAEIYRHTHSLGPRASFSVQLPDIDDRSLVAKYTHDLVRCLISGWHRLGVPLLPSLDFLSYAGSVMSPSPRPHLRSMSWWCPLPMRMSDGKRPVALVTGYDFALDGDAREAFQADIDEASRAPDEVLPMVAANGTDVIGVITRFPHQYLEQILTAGLQVLEQGLPTEGLPVQLRSDSPEDWLFMADKMSRFEAHLLASALYRGAAARFMRAGDIQSSLLSHEKEAIAERAVGQPERGKRLLSDIIADATDFGFTDVASHIEQTVREMFPSELASKVGALHEPTGPFTFDPGTGKVIGGMFIEDAEHEYKAAELLNATWDEMFPGVPSPFCAIYFVNAFDYEAPVLGRLGETKKLHLGQIGRQAWGARLDKSDLPSLAGNQKNSYLLDFALSIFRALRLMHFHLNGAFTSLTGTSLSAGNLTPDPKIYDYETVRIPQLGDTAVGQEYQHADIVHGFALVLNVAGRLSTFDALPACLVECFKAYQDCRNRVTDLQDKVILIVSTHLPGINEQNVQQKLAHSLADALLVCSC